MANAHQYGGKPRPDSETKDRTGRQSPQQAAITAQGSGGRSDAERNGDWGKSGGEAGRTPPAIGGSSAGKSDQNAADGPREGRKVAGGLYRADQEREAREKGDD